MKKQEGFSLIELLVTMAVFVIVIAAAVGIFVPLVNQFKQQSKIAETNIEGIIGLELLRLDMAHAGYGLPWFYPGTLAGYNEASSFPASTYNDTASNPPRSILSGNNMAFAAPNNIFDGTDYLVIKSTAVAASDASQRWSYRTGTNPPRVWGVEDFAATDRVIFINPKASETRLRELVISGGAFSTTYSAPFTPAETLETYLIYGVDPDTNLQRPFNRADYFIWRGSADPATDDVPDRCAPNTGVLRKAVVNHSAGTFQGGILPLLDCVADMQIIFGLDNDGDGDFEPVVSTDGWSEDITALTAQQVRDQVKEIRVYILAHEGQMDLTYTYPTQILSLGGDIGLGRNYDLAAGIGANWQNYRWKVYTLVVRPENLR